MEIRPANPSDADAIKAFDETARTDPSRVTFIDRRIESGQCFVAVADGRPIAYAVLSYTFYGHGFVEMLYVHRAFRRQGIGAALISCMEQRCETPKLFTSTNQSNTPMQSLLTKLRYQPSGVIENLDEGDPELVYMKRLKRSRLTRR